MNYECPYCNAYMEPMWFVSNIYVFEGMFKCLECRREVYVIHVDNDFVYGYPFEGVINET